MLSRPIAVSGVGQAIQHNQVRPRVRDQAGAEIGTGTASVSGGLVHLSSVEVTLT